MRKKFLSWLGTFLILAGAMLPAVHAVAAQRSVEPQSSGSWGMTSSGPSYADGNTTWTYTFSRTGRPHDLSHMDVVLCNAFDADNVDASHNGTVGPDAALDLPHVIKWEAARLRGTDTVTVTYEGLWATGSQSWYIKAGQDVYSGTISGPVCEPLTPDLEVEKAVSTTNDPATGQGSVVLTGGGTVYYFYTITNTGNVPLSLDLVTDDRLGDIDIPESEIGPGESVTAVADKTFPSLEPGSPTQTETNTVTVTASFAGQSIGPKSASATVFNEAPEVHVGFTVTKTVSGSPTEPGSNSLTLDGGGTAYFHYTVTNTGDVPITISAASDDILGEISALVGLTIPVGGTETVTEGQVFDPLPPNSSPETVTNTVTVIGTYPGAELDPRRDSATVINNPPAADPAFTIAKTVSTSTDPATGKETESLVGGGTAYFFYAVTNTGNVPLSLLNAADDRLGSILFDKAVIAPGEAAYGGPVPESFNPLPAGSDPETVVNTVTVTLSYNRLEMVGTDTATVINQPLPAEQTGDFTITKLVSPEDDIGSAQKSITLTGGGTAWFFYSIHNTGELALHIDSVVDSVLGTIPVPSGQQDLAPGATVTLKRSQSFPSLAPGSASETTTNQVTVTGTFDDGSTVDRGDRASVVNEAEPIRKAFSVSKLVSATNDPATGADSLSLQGGGTAWFFFTVTNTGNVPLTITEASDDVLGSLGLTGTTLAPGQSSTVQTLQKSFPALGPLDESQAETNTVTVTASFPSDGSTATAADTASVINNPVAAQPDFTLTKRVSTVNNPSTGAPSITLTGGGTAWFFYTVTNTGNVPLMLVDASDDVLGSFTFDLATLDPGESAAATLSQSFSSPPVDQTVTNTAVVTVLDHREQEIAKSAQATVINRVRRTPPPPEPITAFSVEKTASTVNDPATGESIVTLTGGGKVFFFYTIRNTGGTPLTIQSATDDKLGALSFTPTTILPGASATASAEKSFGALPVGAADQSETNTLTVTVSSGGITHGPKTAQATVVNRAETAKPDFTVSKRVSAANDSATGSSSLTLPAGGGTAYFFYTITNTGNVPITVAEATDDKLGPVIFTPETIPVGGTATAMISKYFAAGQQETNVVTVKGTHGGVVFGPKTDSVSVLVASEAVGSLEVRVLDNSPRNDGAVVPIAGATVTISGGHTGTTDATGTVLFTALPHGTYHVTGSSLDPVNPVPTSLKVGNGSAKLSAPQPDEVVTLLLSWDTVGAPPTQPAPSIAVTVCNNVTPLGGQVTAAGPDGVTRAGTLASDGRYLLTDLSAGSWTVTLSGPGLAEPVTRTLILHSDGTVAGNSYALDLSGVCPSMNGAVAGRICSPRAPGAEIRGLGPNGETALASVPTDGKLGEWREYRLANLVPGSWILTLLTPGVDAVSQTVEVRAGAVTTASDFTLACTGQAAQDFGGTWLYLTGGLLVGVGLLLRRRASV